MPYDEQVHPTPRTPATWASPSKRDTAIYSWAGRRLGIRLEQGLAIEDATSGVVSASTAGFEVLGNVMFVAPTERAQRIEDLRVAGGVIQGSGRAQRAPYGA
jgi:beta-phosphoglucomutase-like phosphatase (HAD superfamily)